MALRQARFCPQNTIIMIVREVAQQQMHLMPSQRNDLEEIFLEHQMLFNGQLKKYTEGQMHAHKYLELFKAKLNHLVDQDVLEKAPRSTWIAGTFIITRRMAESIRFLTFEL